MDLKPVSVNRSDQIRPSTLDFERRKYELTVFDSLMRYAPYQKRILFYDEAVKDDQEYEKLLLSLKNSLSKALVSFPPVAGRLRTEDGISVPLLELDCTDEVEISVKFSEARTDTSLKQLSGDYDFEPCDFCDSLCDIGSPPPKFPWKVEDPLLFVQVTRFGCGGVSVGVAFSHQAMDGGSAWRFINSWAKLARNINDIAVPEVFYGFKKPNLSKEQIIEEMAAAGFKKTKLPVEKSREEKPKIEDEELKTKLFKLTKSEIDKLRAEAGTANDGRRFSTYVVICAHFWRKITAARALPSASNFTVLADCRGKLESVPKTYFGNAVSALLATAQAEELLTNPLSFAASLLHERIVSYNGRRAEAVATWFESSLTTREVSPEFNFEPYVLSVSSPRHPVYEADFGFGKPVGATFGRNDLHQGKLYLFPSADGGGVDATVVLNKSDFQRLLTQDET